MSRSSLIDFPTHESIAKNLSQNSSSSNSRRAALVHETSTAFLQQLRANYPGPLVVIWDNGPAHRGEAIRSYLTTPDLHLRLVALPAYSPDFTADEAVWDWAREEVTANECLGTKAKVQEKMYVFFGGLAHRKDEVKHRCRTLLQARADALMMKTATPLPSLQNVVPTLALV